MATFYGPRVAAAADGLADSLAAAGPDGTLRPPTRRDYDFEPPGRDRASRSRTPAVADWQAVDRGLSAIESDESQTLRDRADAYRRLGAAARALAAAKETPQDGYPRGGVRFLRSAVEPYAAGFGGADRAHLCERCVEKAVNLLEQEMGDDWRSGGAE